MRSSVRKFVAWGLVLLAVTGGLAWGTSDDPTAGPKILYRVNAGGPRVAADVPWRADTVRDPAPYVNAWESRLASTRVPVDLSHGSIPPGTPAGLFQTERWDPTTRPNMIWHFKV